MYKEHTLFNHFRECKDYTCSFFFCYETILRGYDTVEGSTHNQYKKIMDYSYLLTPLFAWIIAGGLKFTFYSIRMKRWAFETIGYGGLPSTHSAIVSSTAALIAFKEGLSHPAFGVSLTLAIIVTIDAYNLRNQVGQHAFAINHLTVYSKTKQKLRERMGHTAVEIAAGLLVGIGVAFGVWVGL